MLELEPQPTHILHITNPPPLPSPPRTPGPHTWYPFIHWLRKRTLWKSTFLHLTSEETEAQRAEQLVQGHTPSECQTQHLQPYYVLLLQWGDVCVCLWPDLGVPSGVLPLCFCFYIQLSANSSPLGLYVKVLHLLGKQGQWKECEEGRGPVAAEDLQVRNSSWREGAGGGAGGRWGDGRISFPYFFCSSPQRWAALAVPSWDRQSQYPKDLCMQNHLTHGQLFNSSGGRGTHSMCSCFLDVCTQEGISENTAILEKNLKIFPFHEGLCITCTFEYFQKRQGMWIWVWIWTNLSCLKVHHMAQRNKTQLSFIIDLEFAKYDSDTLADLLVIS